MHLPKEHRKQLVQEYKRQSKKIGAYCLRNIENGKCFVGVSRDIEARLNRHRFSLRSNAETVSAELQRDWNLYGEGSFEFTILDTIEPPKGKELDYDPTQDLSMLEQLWLEQLNAFIPQGYNKQRERKGE